MEGPRIMKRATDLYIKKIKGQGSRKKSVSKTVKAGIQSPMGRLTRYLKKSQYAIVASLLESPIHTVPKCVNQIKGDLTQLKIALDQFTSKVK